VAGGSEGDALRLGLGMAALQASIGSLNDLHDAALDAGRKPGKPIPAGLITPGAALVVVIATAAAGLALSWMSGPATAAVAAAVLGIGYAYDLRFKGTAWSWLPFAVGIPFLPIYAWVGVAASLPPSFAVLLPCAGLAGAALATANALADLERDRAAGITSVALHLGREGAWRLHAALLVGVVTLSLGTLPAFGGEGPGVLVAVAGGAAILVGTILARGRGARVRERAWELEAIGVAILAAGWLAAVHLGGPG
jgi:4-hydroxybenzoate polyprenyltransferase